METIDISAVLNEHGYLLQKTDSKTIIIKKSASGSVIFVLFMIAGASLLTFGLYYGLHYSTVLSGAFFIGVPLIYQRWKYPNKIEIDTANKELTMKSGVSYVKKFRLNDISSLIVDESVVSSDVSPFKDGYQDFIYDFRLVIGGSHHKLLNLTFREEQSDTIRSIVDTLSEELQLPVDRSSPASEHL